MTRPSIPDNSVKRRNQVLAAMLKQGKITQSQHDAAVAADVGLKIAPAKQGCAAAEMAPYFCDYVSHLILNNPAYGADVAERERKLYRGGLTIRTHAGQQAAGSRAGSGGRHGRG